MKREPGWHKDPYFRNQERYWDGEAWSQQTRSPTTAVDSGTPADANPPATSSASEESATPPAGPASQPADTAMAMLGAPVPGQPPKGSAATSEKPTKGGGSKQKSEPRAKGSSRSGSGDPVGDEARRVPPGAITMPGPPTARPGQGSPGRRRGVLVALAVLVLVFVAAGVYLLRGNGGANGSSGGGGGGGATASQTGVATAVQKTLSGGTVDAAVDVKVSTAKGSATQKILSGTGGFDLKNQAGTMSLTVPGAPATEANTQIVFIGPAVYVNLGPRLSSLIPGKTWITATPAQLASSSSGLGPGISSFEQLLGNPTALVQQLNTNEARFTSLGSTTFDGAQVQRYQVKLSPALGSTTTSPPGAPSGATAGAHTGEDVYVSSKGLVKAIEIPVLVSANGQSFHESITLVFSHYGHPVAVIPPPAPELATLAQYVAAAGQAGPGTDSSGVLTGPGPAPSPKG